MNDGAGTRPGTVRRAAARAGPLSRAKRRQERGGLTLGAEADRRLLVDDDGAEAERKSNGELLERDVDDPPEDRRALCEADDSHRVRRVGGVSRRRHADDGVTGERPVTGQRDRLPRARAAARAELLRRDGDLTAAAAANASEAPFAHVL